MEPVILVIHLILAAAIIILVLLQRSEGGGLGIGGGGAGDFASPRGTANFLTKMTAYCAAAFFITSLTLGVLAGTHTRGGGSILDAYQQAPASVDAGASDEATTSEDESEVPVEENSEELPSAPIAE